MARVSLVDRDKTAKGIANDLDDRVREYLEVRSRTKADVTNPEVVAITTKVRVLSEELLRWILL